jgi:Domain of unknown function (DUF4132)
MASTKKVNPELETKSRKIELNLDRSIDLDPEDWYWATWRNLPPLQRPEAKPFDLQDCLERLQKVTEYWNWSKAKIAVSLSPEEAHFWCCAMAEPKSVKHEGYGCYVGLSLEELSGILTEKSFDGKISPAQARKACTPTSEAYRGGYHLSEISPLINILTTQQLINFPSKMGLLRLLIITEGFRVCLFPYLMQSEISKFRSYLQSRLNVPKSPVTEYGYEISSDFYFASGLRFYDELLMLVESWDDDEFISLDRYQLAYIRPQEIIFGLKDPQLVEKHMRRLGLKLQPPGYSLHHSLSIRSSKNIWGSYNYIRAWLAHTEYSALDVIRDTILDAWPKQLAEKLLKNFALVKAPEAAIHMLELMLDSTAPQAARKWLQDNPAHAIAGLIPVVAEHGKLADAAIEFLRSMKRKGYTDFIQTCLDRESPEIATKVRSTILDFEEKSYISFDEDTTPKWLEESLATLEIVSNKKVIWQIEPVDLPLILCGDYCLNNRQVEAVLNALKQSEWGRPDPLTIAIKTHANVPELDAFAWELFERWQKDGLPTEGNWALRAIGIFGSNPSALKLASLIRIWPGINQHSRAVAGLLCLQSIGTDIALMQIHGIAQKVKFKGIKQRAQECMEAIATERNMSREQLEDRIVPDCELDEHGTRMFDFGVRQFQFVLSENLKPMVKDVEGKIKTDLPKPNAKDDREKAENAIAEWKSVKKQVNEILKLQPARLERAMVTGRRWQVDEFVTLLVRHPLMTHLVRRIVWGGYDAADKLISTFRVTEDLTYADDRDETYELVGLDRIGIVHPLYLSPEQLANWGEILSDYEIMPPFQQIGRSIYKLESGEEIQTEITRFKDAKVPAIALVGMLEKSGWVRGTPQDAGIFAEHSKTFPAANVTAIVEYQGVPIGYMDAGDDQSIERCYFRSGTSPNMYANRDRAIGLGNVDSLVISEVLRDLTSIASKAN